MPTAVRMMAAMATGESGSDAALEDDLRAVAEARDRAAFARVFAFYGPRVKAYLRRLGAEDAVAEDLTQEVMLSIWRRAHQFDRTRAALGTWVYTIARNKRIDALRRERRPDFDPEDPALVPEDGSAPRGDRHAEAEQVRRGVMEAVEQLPAEQARLLRIFYFEEKPHSVIAEELGLPLGTVKSRLRLALAKLRVLLDGFDG
jgi:RNA polymerase sigma factor (sigma-70 family)